MLNFQEHLLQLLLMHKPVSIKSYNNTMIIKKEKLYNFSFFIIVTFIILKNLMHFTSKGRELVMLPESLIQKRYILQRIYFSNCFYRF